MEKFLIKFVKTDAELETDLDKWLYVLKNMSRIDKIPVYLRKPIFEKLFSIAEYSNLSKEEKTMYDRSLKYKWDNKNVLDYALKEGIEKGRHEEALNIARELKKDRLATEFIAKTTKLSIEEIENL
ncbi:PD-(D/E)XK nuclease family transposase [Mucilaginibacter sp.]|uniref:PD-(D/E)XK nuclease family transposase n=1 Tax=Mucilaginibacter sp. TaxID=1882438 RepID=UPI00284FD150|nr:PD-(D/E)XK nuclease family transposase [Mucilaginibacter sp.]MDR3695028.1 PD-(D/E)XK nuclease family transposase [Mucilaginibacter sp.]